MEANLEEETLCRMALTRIHGIGAVYAKKIFTRFGDAISVFRAKKEELLASGVKKDIAAAIAGFRGWEGLDKEFRLLQQKAIHLLFYTDKDYPQRLSNIPHSPPLLFYRGNADLNAKRIVAVVGTRRPSDYGRKVTEQLIRQMAEPGWVIISGLALGIDTAAHHAALSLQIPTVGILGHGFGHFYPQQNLALAKTMLGDGGLLSSFPYAAKPDAYRFPDRNQVVAGLCDALLVVETSRKGGSLVTVAMAKKYDRRIFAVPGRISDTRSSGCNNLIREGIARMITSGEQLPVEMGWGWPKGGRSFQGSLPLPSAADCDEEKEAGLLSLLQQKDSFHIDELTEQTGMASSTLALLLVTLELKGFVSMLPGRRYKYNAAEIRA